MCSVNLRFYRAMYYSAKRGIEIACRPSIRLSVGLSVSNVGGSGPTYRVGQIKRRHFTFLLVTN